jgi:DNA-directed RNA polymerase subunit alpha
MNPDLVICHLDDGADAQHGTDRRHRQGLCPGRPNRPADAPIGLIPVDALYSPVRQVAYKVDRPASARSWTMTS